jgi:holo-[acyl-carrier protein] synthase
VPFIENIMIIGLGIDIVDQIRIRKGIEKHGDNFTNRLFTIKEITYCQKYSDPIEHYAGKFAVKEAFMKAIGTGLSQQVTFKDIEVLNKDSGAPYIITHGKTEQIVKQLTATKVHVSLSHVTEIAAAVVILETEN